MMIAETLATRPSILAPTDTHKVYEGKTSRFYHPTSFKTSLVGEPRALQTVTGIQSNSLMSCPLVPSSMTCVDLGDRCCSTLTCLFVVPLPLYASRSFSTRGGWETTSTPTEHQKRQWPPC